MRYLRTATNFILGSLALLDVLNGILGTPFYLACSAIRNTVSCGITQVPTRFFSISIVLHFLLVSIDRFIAVVHPMRYLSYQAKSAPFTTRRAGYGYLCRHDTNLVDWFQAKSAPFTTRRAGYCYLCRHDSIVVRWAHLGHFPGS